MIGRTLSHFKITAKLGEGAMGEVWRSTDTTLNREVALKVLPEELAADPERLERFKREAQAIAALNHPNIVTIYSVEEADGIHLLTMELVEGKSLDQLLPTGGFDLDQLFPLAIQIADALAAAHDKGIVHRDLKPANVMVTDDGRVKVLDFGLAKLVESEADEDEETQLMTQAGMILGTVPYMSPEQVQAQPVDHRSDVFSLGILLYEMATGSRPFQGDNAASVISAVLKEQPPSVTQLRETLPNHLGRIVRRCLEKQAQRRYQSAREIQLELEGLESEMATSGNSATPSTVTEPEVGRASNRIGWVERWIWLGAVVVLLGLAFFAVLSDGPPIRSTRIVLPLDPAARLLANQAPAVSPDGRAIAYTVREGPDTQIYLQRLDSFDAVPVAGTERGEAPFFSPDGGWIGFVVGGEVFKVAVQGGNRTLLEPDGFMEPSAHWHRDDEIILGGDAGYGHDGLLIVAADGSGSKVLTTIDEASGERTHESPHVLADGTILFAVLGSDGRRVARYWPDRERWEVLELEAEPPAVIVSGRLVYQWGDSVLAVRWKDEEGPVGEPLEILSGVGHDEWTISPSGTIAYLSSEERGSRVVAVDREGRSEVLIDRVGSYDWPRVSPDGTRFVVGHVELGEGELWVHEIDSGRSYPLPAPGSNGEPTWAPDGRRVAYSNYARGGGGDIHWQLTDGSGTSDELYSDDFGLWPTSFSPDGRELAYYGTGGGEDAIWILSIDSERAGAVSPRQAVDGPGVQRAGAFSPDGNWFAYSSDESGRDEIYLRPYPELDARRYIVSREGGVDPHWSADSRELFYRNGDAMLVAEISPESEAVVGSPRELFRGHFHYQENEDQSFDVFPDGERFLMIQPTPESRRELRVITNALEGLSP